MFDLIQFLKVFINTAIYTVFGLAVFLATFMAIVKAVPFSMRKEIEEDQNTALAIIVGAVILGIAFIIAFAIHG